MSCRATCCLSTKQVLLSGGLKPSRVFCVCGRYVADPPEFNFSTGYAYAIATTSNVVMQYLKTLSHSKSTYTINYPGTIANA